MTDTSLEGIPLQADCRLQFNRTGRLAAMTCFTERTVNMYQDVPASMVAAYRSDLATR